MSVTTGLTPKFKIILSATWLDGQQANIVELGLKLLILLVVKPVMVGVTINLMSEYSMDSTTNLAIVSLMPIVPV